MIENILLNVLVNFITTTITIVISFFVYHVYEKKVYGGWKVFSIKLSVSERKLFLNSELERSRIIKSAIASKEGRFVKVDFATLKESITQKRIYVDYE